MTMVPLLPGPAVLPLRPPRFSCGSASITIDPHRMVRPVLRLAAQSHPHHASRITPALSASRDSSRSSTTSKTLFSFIRQT